MPSARPPRRAHVPRALSAAAVSLGVAALVAARRPAEVAPAAGEPCPFVVARPADAPALAREFRAAWISPVESGEWPSSPDLTDADHQQELRDVLDRASAVGLNAVIVHVRPAADALYPSARAPWSSYIARDGLAPRYDPLQFALGEAHRRGLQFHAWYNPFRAAPPDRSRPAVGAARIAETRPEWVVRYGGQRWIDPGDPEARAAVLAELLDVVARYDVDAVHLDDYFYPYLEERTWTERVRAGGTRRRPRYRMVRHTETIPFPDDRTWERYGRPAGFRTRGDWRRENVSQFVRALYEGVKARKPWVQVGISPFGIWRPGAPAGLTGLDAYAEIFADSRRWWREGWLDYLAPQLYWRNDNDQRRNQRLDAWWRAENARERHLYPGMLTMRVASGAARWAPSEIEGQIAHYRDVRAGSPEALGHVHFRMQSLLEEAPGGLGDRLRVGAYVEPALPPASPWLGEQAPGAPRYTGCSVGAGAAVAVAASAGEPPRWWAVQWRDALGRWSLRAYPAAAGVFTARLGDGSAATAMAVRAVSATGVAGPALVLTTAAGGDAGR